MKFINIKCRKCGYEIQIPETSASVVCGSCGNVNHLGKISSILKKFTEAGEMNRSGEIQEELNKSSYKSIPDQASKPSEADLSPDEEEIDFTEEKTASKILTIVFILVPFIAMAVEFFKLPTYIAVLVVMLVVVAALALKLK